MSHPDDSVEVTVEISGETVVAGALWFHARGPQSATFRYAASYLRDARSYDLDPALPRSSGVFQTVSGRPMFNAFADSAPDRWGRNLMLREEQGRATSVSATSRTLLEVDYLLGVRDDNRQGAIRYRRAGTDDYFSTHLAAVPSLVEVGKLLRAADEVEAGAPISQQMRDLFDAGSSLGGARPKASVVKADGTLAIAKFPRETDDWDVIGWEKVELDLAARSGLTVAASELIKIGRRHVLLVDRFDRVGERRLGYASALTLLEASDGDSRSYVEIAEVIEQVSDSVEADLAQLYRRMSFSVLTANTDDHLRNHGFLRGRTGWILSPAFDLNPDPIQVGRSRTSIDLGRGDATVDALMSVAGYFRLSDPDARRIITEVEAGTRDWRALAAIYELPPKDIDLMTRAFESEQRAAALALSAVGRPVSSTPAGPSATLGPPERVPRGVSTGGQFARTRRPDPER